MLQLIISSPLIRVMKVQVKAEFLMHNFMVDKGQSQKGQLDY